jgi:hypothetical protein
MRVNPNKLLRRRKLKKALVIRNKPKRTPALPIISKTPQLPICISFALSASKMVKIPFIRTEIPKRITKTFTIHSENPGKIRRSNQKTTSNKAQKKRSPLY